MSKNSVQESASGSGCRSAQSKQSQQGVVLIIMLALLLAALTSAVIAKLSLNKKSIERNLATSSVLVLARDSLIGYALRQPTIGTLPCPDTDDPPDGLANFSGTTCTDSVGLLPYRTLSLNALRDGSGALLWYAVAPAYTDNLGFDRNSSIDSHFSLDGAPVSAVVIGPGAPLNSQQRTNYSVTEYLEGENANASEDTYEQYISDQQNDEILAIDIGHFWNIMEQKILSDAADLIQRYQAACSAYPWAAPYGSSPNQSSNNLQNGHIPFDTALPDNWNTGCALGISPSSQLVTHWSDQLFYQFCTAAEGNCLTVQGYQPLSAELVLLAPGNILAGQNRSILNLDNFFEGENNNVNNVFERWQPSTINSTFNDSIYVYAP